MTGGVNTTHIQETSDGCFLYHDQYIYRYDNRDNSITVLCSKPNCLHDKETDPKKQIECNAFLDGMIPGGTVTLMLYNENLYICYEELYSKGGKYPSAICRMAGDGSAKEVIYEHSNMLVPMQHRGYIYFVAVGYSADTDNISGSTAIKRVDITSQRAKEEVIYQADFMVNGGGFLMGYGNHIYCCLSHYGSTEDSFIKLFDYDINRETCTESPFVSKQPYVFQSRLIGADDAALMENDSEGHFKLYSAALDGSDLKVIKED